MFNPLATSYAAGVDAGNLTTDQRRALAAAVLDRRNWLHRLHMRQRANGWSEDDATYLATLDAYQALHKLWKLLNVEVKDMPSNWTRHIGPG